MLFQSCLTGVSGGQSAGWGGQTSRSSFGYSARSTSYSAARAVSCAAMQRRHSHRQTRVAIAGLVSALGGLASCWPMALTAAASTSAPPARAAASVTVTVSRSSVGPRGGSRVRRTGNRVLGRREGGRHQPRRPGHRVRAAGAQPCSVWRSRPADRRGQHGLDVVARSRHETAGLGPVDDDADVGGGDKETGGRSARASDRRDQHGG